MSFTQIKPGHKAIQAYYDALKGYDSQRISHEGAVSTAFQSLLIATGQEKKWALIPQLTLKIGGKSVRPDGTFRDEWHLPRGYWEAKDSADDLDAEIKKKAAKGYPLGNTIFEDTRTAVLFQNGLEARRIPLADPGKLADLLTDFYRYTTPDYEGFNQAVAAFKERIPDLARGLAEKITHAHKKNRKFIAAFADFLELCKTSLNPNIRVEAVDEMLVQHLLTERLFRTIFQNADFTRRNVIAAEIETVIDALTSGSFSRTEFLKSLDTFYVAIEGAAASIQDFSQKQHFLNTVYERFFQGYSVKVADTHGIVYTPQEIVDFMCASVEEVLRTEFGKGLGDEGVTILDPCTGTGNFIVNLMRRIPKKDLPRAYKEQLFANEVMLLPYYIASMNIEHEYWELTGGWEAFEGLCFVDTLELRNTTKPLFSFMNEKNTARVDHEQKAYVNVIIGNPPYNVGQLNENDNNKNRVYRKHGKADAEGVDDRIGETYSKDSQATNKHALSDMFVKFFRWASDRLDVRDGIVCFVTNNAFVENTAFDGMRKHLLTDFDRIYHLHMCGDVRQNPNLSGTAYNVFGIQVGVGITLAVRNRNHLRELLATSVDDSTLKSGSSKAQKGLFQSLQKEKSLPASSTHIEPAEQAIARGNHQSDQLTRVPRLLFWKMELEWRRHEKLRRLAEFHSVGKVAWNYLKPAQSSKWLISNQADVFSNFVAMRDSRSGATIGGSVFRFGGPGFQTNRDEIVFDFSYKNLLNRVKKFASDYNLEIHRIATEFNESGFSIDDFVDYSSIRWSSSLKSHAMRGLRIEYKDEKLRTALFRPFCKKFVFLDRVAIHRPATAYATFPTEQTELENRTLVTTTNAQIGFSTTIVKFITCLDFGGRPGQSFPFYIYDEEGTNRRENITDWALKQFHKYYKNPNITKWDIFHYVYGVLHQPEYRTTFADNLKRELPRIPFMADFEAFAGAGRALAKWHLEYESVDPWPLTWVETPGVPLSYEVARMKLSKDKATLRVNDWLTLADIPPEVARYRLGNRSALEWVVDQYQVSEDARSGIRSDPNRLDDPEYIVRLVGQVVRVSVETVRIVEALPTGIGVGLEPA